MVKLKHTLGRKMGLATFWAIFLHTHLVTLPDALLALSPQLS
jgi:hypothetical protein